MKMLKRQWMLMLMTILLFGTCRAIAQENPNDASLTDPRSEEESSPAKNFGSDVGSYSDSEYDKEFDLEDFKIDSEGAVVLGIGQRYRIKKSKPVASIKTGGQGGIQVSQDSKGVMEVTGESVGKANLHISFADKSSHTHSFVVESESYDFEAIIKKLFPKAELEIVPIRDTAIFLRGTVESEAEVQQIEEIAQEFWPSVHNHIQSRQATEIGFNGYPPVVGRAVQQPIQYPSRYMSRSGMGKPNESASSKSGELLFTNPVPHQDPTKNRSGVNQGNPFEPSRFERMQPPVKSKAKPDQNGINSIRNDLSMLRAEVKKLIELLESRKIQEEGDEESESDVSFIPETGKSVAFFHATWSAPDQKMKPVVKKLQAKGLQIVSIDIDQHPQLAREMKVTKVPTFVKLVDGEEAHSESRETRKSGLMSEEELREFIASS